MHDGHKIKDWTKEVTKKNINLVDSAESFVVTSDAVKKWKSNLAEKKEEESFVMEPTLH